MTMGQQWEKILCMTVSIYNAVTWNKSLVINQSHIGRPVDGYMMPHAISLPTSLDRRSIYFLKGYIRHLFLQSFRSLTLKEI